MIDVRKVGFAPDLVPYRDGWALQREIHRAVADGNANGALLLLEHEAVYTAGARTARDERPTDGTPVIDVDRGGKITWHGPGQLVGYPILRLPDPVDVVAHVRRLEGILIDVLRAVGTTGFRVAGRSGVWMEGAVTDEKVAAIGVRVQRGVTMHGFALNCSNDLAPFSAITPCGISDAGVTTLSRALGHPLTPADLADLTAEAFTAAYAREVAA